jgi:hypothetical protein
LRDPALGALLQFLPDPVPRPIDRLARGGSSSLECVAGRRTGPVQRLAGIRARPVQRRACIGCGVLALASAEQRK